MSKLTANFISQANHDAAMRAHHMGFGARTFLTRAFHREGQQNGGGRVGYRPFTNQTGMQRGPAPAPHYVMH